jgi:hypothetical protein
MVAAVVGVEGDREQPALAPGRDSSVDVEERPAPWVAAVNHPHPAPGFDDVEVAGGAGGMGDIGRLREVADLVLADPAAPIANPQISGGAGAGSRTRGRQRQRKG